MESKTVLAVPALALLLVAAGFYQQSTKVDFKTSIEKATKAYEAKTWGECTKHVRNALQSVQVHRVDGIRATLPAAPTGMKVEDTRNNDNNLLFAGYLCQVERSYRTEDGEKSIRVNVQADSPAIAGMIAMLTNPLIVQSSGGEVLEYGKNKAVLTKQGNEGNNWKLQIVIDQAHLIDVDANGTTREELLKVFDDAAVAKIAKELTS